MKEITLKLRKQALEKYRPLIISLAKEGVDKDQIVRTVEAHIQGYIKKYYKKLYDPQPIKNSLSMAFRRFAGLKKADSKAEDVFYFLLKDNGIVFSFQYNIGPYRVDYLISDDLVVELDGPLHNKKKDAIRDKYLEKMGYRILRIPIWLVATSPDAVIIEIKRAGG